MDRENGRDDAHPLCIQEPGSVLGRLDGQRTQALFQEEAMPEYTDRIDVAASPDAVFHFVSDVKNLPKYLPTVHQAHSQAGERVEVDGKANGHAYSSEGWFKVDQAARTMTWGSDGDNGYSGKMAVSGEGSGSKVECSLHFTPTAEIKESMDKNQGGPSAAMTDGLRASLASIKEICEGTGGKHASTAE